MTVEERFEVLLRNVLGELREDVQRNLPPTHRFKPIGIRFRFPDSEYIGTLMVCCSETDRHKRRVAVQVCKEGTDRSFENIYPEMSSDEIKLYLAEPGTYDEIKADLQRLFAKAHDYWE